MAKRIHTTMQIENMEKLVELLEKQEELKKQLNDNADEIQNLEKKINLTLKEVDSCEST